MDFKGMKWVGNVYQKFEAMCLEVEEIIVQDTAKYMETQVQTVGKSVKKFCSDVVQELIPDDPAGSGKPSPVSMLHEYAPVCSFKKKKENMNRKNRDVKQEQELAEGKKDGCAQKFRGLDADDYNICTSPRQYSYGGPYRRTRVGRKQIYKKEELFQDNSPYIQTDSRSLSVVHSDRVKDDVGSVNSSSLSMAHNARIKDDVGTVNSIDSPPVKEERLISKQECQKNYRTENQHGLRVVKSVRSQDSEIKTENEQGLMVVDFVRSKESEIRTENEHDLTVAHSVRSQDLETEPSVATILPAGSYDCRKGTDEDLMEPSSSSVSVQESEIFQHLSGRSVEESCILVDRDEFHYVLPDKMANDKHKPYKNIREAICSRMKQNREKEYKRLARQWYAEDVENGRECGDNPEPLEENQSSEESEWELL